MKGIGKFFGGKAKQKAAKEQARAEQQQIDNKYKSDFDMFENQETGRQSRAGFVGSQLKGARALSPEVLAQAMQRRKNTAYKGAVADKSKGMGTAMLGDALGGIGDIASAMNKESMIAKAEQGGGGLLSQASQIRESEACPPHLAANGAC